MLNELIERVERLTGEDRFCDSAIYKAMHGKSAVLLRWLPCYTASLDAAVTLVPEGMVWQCGYDAIDGHWARVGEFGAEQDTVSMAPTPALALTLAALRAQEAQND